MTKQKIVGWFTSKGKHIPILEGQSKEEALSNYIKNSDKNKSVAEKNEDIKQKQIAKNKEQADKLNNKKVEKKVDDADFKELSNKDADDILSKETDNVLSQDNAYADMKDSLINYTYGGHSIENRILRNQDTGDYDADDIEMFKEEIANVESAIDKFNLGSNIKVYRKTLGDFSNLRQGDVFKDDGFVSASTSKEFVSRFKGALNELTGNAYTLEINVPAGKKRGIFLSKNVSKYPEEYEFLLQRGTEFRVDKIDHNSKSMIITIVGNNRKAV